MIFSIEDSWKSKLLEEFNKTYFKSLSTFIREEYKTQEIFPPANLIFNAFEKCPFHEVKVVIIGQDPYHNLGQANGLCFSVNDGVRIPPSLINIYKEIHHDLGKSIPKTGNLEKWSKQGVLLLNATLTVRANSAGSHQKKGWETFTNAVIKTLSDQKENVVFLLWGGYAKQKVKFIDASKHHIITSGHPSPLSANRGYWFGNQSFSKTNAQLKELGLTPIAW